MDTKALRQKILDLAIRGRLVPQDPNDEPASLLLERIREEKKQMVKEGKLKAKDIKNDTIIFKGEDNLHYEKFQDGTVKCIEEEIPFDVPNGWEWCRLSNICLILNGDRGQNYPAKSKLHSEGIPFVSASNIIDGEVSTEGLLYLSDEQYDLLGAGKLELNDIVFCIRGSLGKCGYFTMEKGAIASSLVIVRAISNKEYLNGYIFNYLNSLFAYDEIKKYDNGSAQPNLAAKDFQNFLVPLPANEEIGRISDKCELLLMNENNISVATEELQDCISNTKSKILDLAIRGKLVPQNPNDEPASILLKRIREEKESLIKQGKIKHDKKESIIYKGDDNSYYELIGNSTKCIDDEIPFEVPNGWSWARGKNIFVPMESRKPTGETFDYIDIDSIDNKNNIVTEPKHLFSSEAPSRASRAVFNGSVVFSTVRPYLKNIAYIDERLENCIASTGFYICTSNGALYPQYMFLLMISHYVVNGLNQYMKGDNSPSINKDDIDNWLFPIPPYNEQIRIQEKVHSCLNNIIEIGANLL